MIDDLHIDPDGSRAFVTSVEKLLTQYGSPEAVMAYVVEELKTEMAGYPMELTHRAPKDNETMVFNANVNGGEQVFRITYLDETMPQLMIEPKTIGVQDYFASLAAGTADVSDLSCPGIDGLV